MSAVKAVIFDLGNVLVGVDHEKAVPEFRRHAGDGPMLDAKSAEGLVQRFERGEITTPQFYEAMCGQGRYGLDLESFCAIYCDMFSPVQEMIDAHAALRARGFPTYIFSNTSALHFSHIRAHYRFMSEFTGFLLSYELGCMKPDAPAYDAVEKATGYRGSELLYIDDRLENVEAGAARGWNTIHHTHPRLTVARFRGMGLV